MWERTERSDEYQRDLRDRWQFIHALNMKERQDEAVKPMRELQPSSE